MSRIRVVLLAVALSVGLGCGVTSTDMFGVLIVRVTDVEGRPVPGAMVLVGTYPGRTEGDIVGSAQTGEDGTAQFPLDPGFYDAWVASNPAGLVFLDGERQVVVYRGEERTKEFRAVPNVTVELTFTWYDDVLDQGPVDGILVELMSGDRVERSVRTGSVEGAPGVARFADLPRYAYGIRLADIPSWVAFDSLDLDLSVTHPVGLIGNERVIRTIEGSLLGDRIVEASVDVDGAPLEGVTAYLWTDRSLLLGSATTGSDGLAVIEDLPAGDVVMAIRGFDRDAIDFPDSIRAFSIDPAPAIYRQSFSGTAVVPGENRPPAVAITTPSNGSTLREGVVVEFVGSATDPEDGALSGTALTWSSDVDGAFGSGPFTAGSLSLGSHVVTLTATDSEGATGTASVTLDVVANRPPSVGIISPTDGTTFSAGQVAGFTGAAVDPEDGTLSGASLTWSSSLDGALGSGDSISVGTLQPGAHVITLAAMDSEGLTGTDSVSVTVVGGETAAVQGRVQVPGAGIANVTVTITGPTGASTVTDAFGDYALGGLPAGIYVLTISNIPTWATFAPTSVEIQLVAGQTLTYDFNGTGG